MTSTPFFFLLGSILFLVWFTTVVHSEKVLYGLKGSSVVLSPGDTETSIISITWKHGADLAAESFGGDQTFYRMFNGSCSLNTKTGELTINDVRPEHGGEYTPEINGRIRSAQKLQVFSPVPKPRIIHDCNPEQTKCILTCSFDRTDDLGDVEVFWILDDRREKGTELQITKDTKEETFICSLNNPVSSQNSTELKNPLLPRGRRHHYAKIVAVIGLIVVIGVGLFWIFCFKINNISRVRNEQRSSAVTENTREERQNNGSPTIITPPETQSLQNGSPAGGDAVHPEERMLLLNNQECNQTSNAAVTVEINPQTEPNTTNMEENTENQNSAPSLDTKPGPESNTSNTQEPAESPAPSSDSKPDPDSPAGGDAVQPKETTSLLKTEEFNQTSNFTITDEINPQTESNVPGSAGNPSPAPSSETKPDPESNTSNRQGPAETPDLVSASETKRELGIMQTTVSEPNSTNMEENTENQNPALSLDTKPDPESNTSNTQEPAENPAPSSDSKPDPGSPAGGDAVQPKETTSLLNNEEFNQTSNFTVPVEINPQTESNLPGSAENPSPAPSSETKPDPESNTSNRQGPAETPDLVSASETKRELGIMQTTVSEPNTTNIEENTENQNPALSLDTKPDPELNISNTQEPAESPAPSSDSNPDPDPETNKEAEDLNPDPPEEDNHETDSGSAENDLPEAERPEDSSGSPGRTVSTSEPS